MKFLTKFKNCASHILPELWVQIYQIRVSTKSVLMNKYTFSNTKSVLVK